MTLFENAPDYINDILFEIQVFLLPFYAVSVFFYYCIVGTFKQKPLAVKVLLIILGIASFAPIIIYAFDDFTWALISFLTMPILSLIEYPLVFSLLIPIPVIIAAKADKKRIAPIWWVLYAAFVCVSVIISAIIMNVKG